MKTTLKNILITGSSGFIGFHLSKYLLLKNYNVIGIDNLSNYYDVNLKIKRQDILAKNNNFVCYNQDIKDKNIFDNIFKKYRPQIVIHLAAQAGVRYSIENPKSYIDANICGSFNLLETLRKYPSEHVLFASSSSVYGGNAKLPFDENQKCDTQLSLYAATKKANEAMCHSYSHNFSIPITLLRFFTVYGPWGRPDMALFKFVKSILNNKKINIYNYGKMERDFTYIDDIVNAIFLLINKVPQKPNDRGIKIKNDSLSSVAPWRVVNIGNSNPIKLEDFISQIEKKLGKEAIKNYEDMQPGDVTKTWSNINLLKNLTKFEPNTSINLGVKNFIDWYINENIK